MIDTLTITFDRDESNKDLSAMCVASIHNGEFYVRNMFVGDKAEQMYKMLTEVSDGNS